MSTTSDVAVSAVLSSERWHGWAATHAWLAETVRATTSGMYAEIEGDDGEMFGVHQNAIVGRITKAFGVLIETARPELSVSETIELLVRLCDLGNLSGGYVIPREMRLQVVVSGWGRLAGGLSLQPNDYAELDVKPLQTPTIGRIVSLHQNFDVSQPRLEHSEILWWSKSENQAVFAELTRQLPERSCSRPLDGSIRYYHPNCRGSRTRRARWQDELPIEPFVVARSISLPARYFVCITSIANHANWFRVGRDQARKWILFAERCYATVNTIYSEKHDGALKVRVPDMLPAVWTAALLGCGSRVTPIDKGWEIVIADEVAPLFRVLLAASNMRII